MDASTIVAICATVIAVASLVVSVYEGRAARRHNRYSVRPLLELRVGLRAGRTAGLQLINAGLGPAKVIKAVLMFDGEPLGEFSKSNVDRMRETLSIRPSAVTFNSGIFLATDYDQLLLSVESFDRAEHAEFADLLNRRLSLEIQYESLYGGEGYKTVWNPT